VKGPADRRGFPQRRRPPGFAAGDPVEQADDARDLRQDGAGNDLARMRDRKVLGQPSGAERGAE